ncbi:MAG: hypothetical protein IKO25_08420 [Clostridia bacterium]|nr:hypothetical protein [Clostridia bacterium]
MINNRAAEKMLRDTWNRAFSDGRENVLMGEGPERLLDASGRLSPAGCPSAACFVEAPLAGKPEYDSLVILNPRYCIPGCRMADPALVTAQAAVDWAAGMGRLRPYLHFELDAALSGTLSGIHCKIGGSMRTAEGFFGAVGEPERTDSFVRIVQSLPKGWFCQYTGVFPGRGTNNTRMEVTIADDQARRALCSPQYLRECFDAIGFTAYDGTMLADISHLAEVEASISIQFDMLPDGSFLPVLSLLSLYESIRPDCSPLFREDGWLKRTCEIYMDMGVSDDRWLQLEPCLFSDERVFFGENGFEVWEQHCFPCCTKMKWIGAGRRPAKFYLIVDAIRSV